MKEGREFSLLRRIFFLLVITLTVSLVGAIVYIKDDVKQDRIKDLVYATSVIKEYYELSFHQWELSLLSVGYRLTEIESESERIAFADKVLEVYQDELYAFGLATPEGDVTVANGRTLQDSLPNLAHSANTKRSFEITKTRNGISLGDCYYFESLEDWILPVRVPLFDENDELIAVCASAVNYKNTIHELNKLGLDSNYQIHLLSLDFGTTQLLYPLPEERFVDYLGKDSLVYDIQSSSAYNERITISKAIEPIEGKEVLSAVSEIIPINHQIVLSYPNSLLEGEIYDSLKPIVWSYFFLMLGAGYLYVFVSRGMRKNSVIMQKEQANLKSIIESTDDIIGLFDTDSRLIEFNKAFELSAKMTDNLDLYKGIYLFDKMQSAESADLFKQYFDRAFSGENFKEIVSYPGPEGTITFEFTYNPIYRRDKIIGLSMFAKDITEIKTYQEQLESYNKNLEKSVKERTTELEIKNEELIKGYEKLKSAQEQLIRAEKMASLGVLAAGIGHEINNPLNFIKHGAEGLQADLEKIEDLRLEHMDGYFNAIYEGVKRASDIVAGIGHFSRAGSSMEEMCDIHAILNNSLSIAATRFKSKQIELIENLESKHSMILGNDGKLHQLFTNLIVNAEQAITTKGTITISTSQEESSIKIEIKDTGSGMSKLTLSRITDPFFTTKEPGEGTGLGLFICQTIIDEHNGTLEIDSEVGKGSSFCIYLPLSDKNQ